MDDLVSRLRDRVNDSPMHAEHLMDEAADTILALEQRVKVLEDSNRLMGDVIDYACDDIKDADDAMDFIEAYREGRWKDYPKFVRYRQVQAGSAALADKGEG